MKLLRTYHPGGDPKGYFDPVVRADYGVTRIADFGGPRFVVDVYTGDGPRQQLSPPFATEAEALTELDRIAALISGEAAPVPSFGWVPGPPPDDGKWYLVRYDDEPTPGVARFSSGQAEYVDDAGQSYGGNLITHHNPTPISLEIS
jgi:hypothetical protein